MNGIKKQHRSKGSGHIFKRGKTFYLQYDINGKRKKVSLKCNHLKDKTIDGKVIKGAEARAEEILSPAVQAKTKEQVLLHVAESRKLLRRGKVRIAEAWETYLNNPSRPDSGKSTLNCYRYMFERMTDWLEEKYPTITALGQITEDVANEYAIHLWNKEVLVKKKNKEGKPEKPEKRKISAKTFNDHIKALRLVTRVLSEEAGIDRNPWEKVQKKQQHQQTRKEFSENEVIKILQAFDEAELHLLHKPEMKVLFHLGAWTGLRLIDCALMKWNNIDLERNLINCVPQKTKKVSRSVIIPIHPQLREQLDKAGKWRQDEYVLPRVAERYHRNPSGVQKDAIRVFEHIGLETSVKINDTHRARKANVYGFHSFRHSFVSFCAKAGVPLPVVQSIVGHGNPAITRHYVHIGEESVRKAIDALPMGTQNKLLSGEGENLNDSLDSLKEKMIEIMHLLNSKKRLTDSDKKILEIITKELPENPEKNSKKIPDKIVDKPLKNT